MRVLVIEDEKKVANIIKKELESQSYEVDVVYDGATGYQFAQKEGYDLILLDIALPRKDGYSILKDLRDKKISTPILVVTAKTAVEERVTGLDSGADDYITKPFAVEELLARVRSLIRRSGEEKSTILKIEDLELNMITHKAKRGDKDVDLTVREYQLLEYLMKNKNKICSRTTIAEHIWNYNFDTGTNIIDVYINHLRQKIDYGFPKRLIEPIRGIGYRIKSDE